MCLNINWGNLQTLTVAGTCELPAFFLCLEVEGCRFFSRVTFFLPCYMGHVCGLQCYDHLGRICGVLTVQKKAVCNFPVEQGSWKADIHSSSQETPSFSGKLTFISELKLPATEGHYDTVPSLFF